MLEPPRYLPCLGVIRFGEEYQDIAENKPLGSPSQSRQPLGPDVTPYGFLANVEIHRSLGYGGFLWHRHILVPETRPVW